MVGFDHHSLFLSRCLPYTDFNPVIISGIGKDATLIVLKLLAYAALGEPT